MSNFFQGIFQNVMSGGGSGGGGDGPASQSAAEEAALPEACQSAEGLVDPLRAAYDKLAKRAEKCVTRKHPEEALAEALKQSAESLRPAGRGGGGGGEHEVLERVLLGIAEAENGLLAMRASHMDSLAEWIETTRQAEQRLAGLQSDRRGLARIVQDLAKLRRRLHTSQLKHQQQQQQQQSQHQQQQSQQQQQAAEAALGELQLDVASREADERKERDAYIVRLNGLLVERPQRCNQLLGLMRARLAYHEDCARLLGEALPTLEKGVAAAAQLSGPCYGVPLEHHLASTGRRIAYVIDVCTAALNRDDVLVEEGLFRINGPSGSGQKLESFLDVMRAEAEVGHFESASVCGALKKYLKQLPEPLISQALLPDWRDACGDSVETDQRRFKLHACCQRLQRDRPQLYDNLRHLVKFLARVADHQAQNKMSPKNLAICIGPNIVGGGPGAATAAANMEDLHSANLGTLIVENLLLLHDFCFGPEDTTYMNLPSNLSIPPAQNSSAAAATAQAETIGDGAQHQQQQQQHQLTLPPKPKLPLSRQSSASETLGSGGSGGSVKHRLTATFDNPDGSVPRRPNDPIKPHTQHQQHPHPHQQQQQQKHANSANLALPPRPARPPAGHGRHGAGVVAKPT